MYPNDPYPEDQFSGQILNFNNLPPAVNTLESHMPRPPLEAIEEIQSVRHSVDGNASSLLSALLGLPLFGAPFNSCRGHSYSWGALAFNPSSLAENRVNGCQGVK